MAGLVLGPMLRYADTTRATIWVETDQPCLVRVLGSTSGTFTVHGRHHAIVPVSLDEFPPNPEYQVYLDDRLVWPDPTLDVPPSQIRAHSGDDPVRISFGSCRITLPPDEDHSTTHGIDVLHALANRGMANPDDLPDLLYLAGDQIYASRHAWEVFQSSRTSRSGPGVCRSTPPQRRGSAYWRERSRAGWSPGRYG